MDFSQYMPHGMCLLWQPWLVILWAGSDLLIFAAYSAIPVALLRVVRGRTDLKYGGVLVLFAAFILLCGLTHLMSIVTLWWPIYPIVGVLKLATGIVSALTAVALFRLVPTLISLPGLGDLEAKNARLRKEIADHEITLMELQRIREELEETVERRTSELKEANVRLATLAREAVHRSGNLLAVVTSIVRQSAKDASSAADLAEVLTGRLTALSTATSAVLRDGQGSITLPQVVRQQLTPLTTTYGDRIGFDGPEVEINAEAAQQIGLALHELATNAQKYGSLAGQAGRIDVAWHIDDADNALTFEWLETAPDGVSWIEPTDGGGFGTRLLMRIVPTMLQGDAEREVSEGQVRYGLRAPLTSFAPDIDWQRMTALAARIVEADFGGTPA